MAGRHHSDVGGDKVGSCPVPARMSADSSTVACGGPGPRGQDADSELDVVGTSDSPRPLGALSAGAMAHAGEYIILSTFFRYLY